MASIDVFYIDLARAYAGAQIVNNASIRSLLAHTDIPNLPVAFDLYLRQLAFNGALKTRLVWSRACPPNAELHPGKASSPRTPLHSLVFLPAAHYAARVVGERPKSGC